MTKPVIGILSNVLITDNGLFPGMERAYVNNDYVEAVRMAGGVPVLIPANDDEDVIKAQISISDGIIITGGNDINPLYYNEEPSQKLGFIYSKIDEFDFNAVKFAADSHKPILGICRGIQLLNVLYGGTLYQDLSEIEGCFIKHFQSSKGNEAGHTVNIKAGSLLHDILGDTVLTNSFHHQCLKSLAPGFVATAVSKDGVIEAIEKDGTDFVLGIQWHPEMMAKDSKIMLGIFKKLINISKRKVV